jgi:glycosyltransferase involved in cell wall biosynthesis
VWLAGERCDVPDVICSFDIFVLPSQSEGISNTILEAMACGLPVIATAVGGNGELVVHDETGSLVPPLDSEALAEALLRYAEDPALRLRQGRAGRQRIEAGFSLDRMMERYTVLYQSLLAASAQRRR